MILERITLTNFRCFDHLDLPLDRHLNVFVGGNGSGKSTILQAIAIGLAPILEALLFESDKQHYLPKILDSDVQFPGGDSSGKATFVRLWAQDCAYSDPELNWVVFRLRRLDIINGDTAEVNHANLASLARFMSFLTNSRNSGKFPILPIFAHYGTNRVSNVPRDRVPDRVLPRFHRHLVGLEDALDTSADFRRSIAWFDMLERQELRNLRDRQPQDHPPAIEAVRTAITTMIDGVSNPRIDGTSGRFIVDYKPFGDTTIKLHVDQLSDGYQALLGVVMDFALRLALVNPGKDQSNPLETEAILMIDEVDLHLHPAWQQEVVGRLRRTFPNTQIILTTHSPQVLSTIDARYIRQINRVGNTATITSPPHQTRGVASSSVLAEVQNVDPVPRVEESELLNQFRAMVAEGTHESDEGRDIRARLDLHFGTSHPVMLDVDRTIRFYEFKRRAAREKA